MAAETQAGVLFEDWPLHHEPAPSQAGDPTDRADAPPRFRWIDRQQSFLRMVDVEALIEDDHPARAIWKVVDQLDLHPFSADAQARKGVAGRAAIDPRLLVSLWIYAYSQGIGSAREISRLCEYHPAFCWLTGATGICGHTLSDFRVTHQSALEKLFVQVVGVLSAEGLVNLKRVMQDGTKIRANAASESFRRRQRLEEHLAAARAQCAALANDDEQDENLVRSQARRRAAQERAERLQAAVEQVQQLESQATSGREPRVSSSDPDARNMKQPDGGFAPSYNVQTTTSAPGKAIVSLEVTQAGNDFQQLTPAIDRLARTLAAKPEQVVADGGYVRQQNIVEMATQGVELIGPAIQTEAKAAQCYGRAGVKAEFYADRFRFDETENCFYCPQGKRLDYINKEHRELVVIQKYQAPARDCAACASKADCCPKAAKFGRSVQRSEYHQEITDFQARMALPENQQIYRQRSEVAETPHLWFKAKFGLYRFHVRGLLKVGQEALWAAITYNLGLLLRHRRKAAARAVLT